MSCLPGSPCYNNDTNCTGDPCNPNSATSCDAVVYNGPNLPVTGIESCDNLCVALQKIDEAITNAASSANLTFTNGLTRTGDVVGLGGLLTTNTTLNVNGKVLSVVGLSSQESLAETDFLLMETASGVVKKVQGTSVGKNITIKDNNNGLIWDDAGIDTILNTVYLPKDTIAGTAKSQQIGDLAPRTADEWRTDALTLRGIIDAILFPLRRPTYNIPTISWTNTLPVRIQEVGTELSFTLTVTGNKWDAGSFNSSGNFVIQTSTDNRATWTNLETLIDNSPDTGADIPAQSYQLPADLSPNSPNKVYIATYTSPTGGSAIKALAPTGDTTIRTVYYKSLGYFTQGFKIKMSDGQDDDRAFNNTPITTAPIGTGTLTTSEISMDSTYPFFYGYSTTYLSLDDIVDRIESWIANSCTTSSTNCTKKLFYDDTNPSLGIATSAGTVSVKIPTTNSNIFFWFAHYEKFTTKTKYTTQGNPTAICEINDTNPTSTMLGPVVKQVTRSQWGTSAVNYKVYRWRNNTVGFPGTTNVADSTIRIAE